MVGAGEHDVGRLHIAVHYPAPVRGVECPGDLHTDPKHPRQRHRTFGAKHRRGVDAVDELHRDPRLPVLDAAVEHVDDVRMIETSDGLGLTFEPSRGAPVGGVGGEQFQGNPTRQSRMVGRVHVPHPACSQPVVHPEAGKDLPGLQLCPHVQGL